MVQNLEFVIESCKNFYNQRSGLIILEFSNLETNIK